MDEESLNNLVAFLKSGDPINLGPEHIYTPDIAPGEDA